MLRKYCQCGSVLRDIRAISRHRQPNAKRQRQYPHILSFYVLGCGWLKVMFFQTWALWGTMRSN
eukprot:5966891-Amphidinium_carterae.1